jgi:hypothetical protein
VVTDVVTDVVSGMSSATLSSVPRAFFRLFM